jgi:hypothetical protein
MESSDIRGMMWRIASSTDNDIGADFPNWMEGECADYAHALLDLRPDLRIGFHVHPDVPWPAHAFAHDDHYAYDGAGRHPLPYERPGFRSVHDRTGEDLATIMADYDEDLVEQAKQHIAEHGTLALRQSAES